MSLRYSYPAFHGVLITIVYSGIKYLGIGKNFYLFGSAIFLAFLLFLPFYKALNSNIFKPILIIKGCLFGLTQILIFETLIGTSVLNTMISSLFGGVIVTLLGYIYLNERLNLQSYIAILLSFLGAFIYYINRTDVLGVSIYAFIAGILQGTTTTLTRTNIKQRFNIHSVIASNLLWGSLVIILYSILTSSKYLRLPAEILSAKEVYLLALLVLIAQFSLYYMMKNSTTQLTAPLTLTRIPTSLLLDKILLSSIIYVTDLAAVVLIIVGMILTIRSSKRFHSEKYLNSNINSKDQNIFLPEAENKGN